MVFLISYIVQFQRRYPYYPYHAIPAFDFFLDMFENNKQSRNNKDLTDHSDKHTTDRSGSQSAVTVGSDSMSEHQRQQSDDHSQGGH